MYHLHHHKPRRLWSLSCQTGALAAGQEGCGWKREDAPSFRSLPLGAPPPVPKQACSCTQSSSKVTTEKSFLCTLGLTCVLGTLSWGQTGEISSTGRGFVPEANCCLTPSSQEASVLHKYSLPSPQLLFQTHALTWLRVCEVETPSPAHTCTHTRVAVPKSTSRIICLGALFVIKV